MAQKPISELEQEVMNIIWELDRSTIREVQRKLGKSRHLAYTTVATILHRLHQKGLVIQKNKGISFLYSPKLTREAYSKSVASQFINRFFDAFGDAAIASFAESIESLPKSKKVYLLELLEDYDKTK